MTANDNDIAKRLNDILKRTTIDPSRRVAYVDGRAVKIPLGGETSRTNVLRNRKTKTREIVKVTAGLKWMVWTSTGEELEFWLCGSTQNPLLVYTLKPSDFGLPEIGSFAIGVEYSFFAQQNRSVLWAGRFSNTGITLEDWEMQFGVSVVESYNSGMGTITRSNNLYDLKGSGSKSTLNLIFNEVVTSSAVFSSSLLEGAPYYDYFAAGHSFWTRNELISNEGVTSSTFRYFWKGGELPRVGEIATQNQSLPFFSQGITYLLPASTTPVVSDLTRNESFASGTEYFSEVLIGPSGRAAICGGLYGRDDFYEFTNYIISEVDGVLQSVFSDSVEEPFFWANWWYGTTVLDKGIIHIVDPDRTFYGSEAMYSESRERGVEVNYYGFDYQIIKTATLKYFSCPPFANLVYDSNLSFYYKE